MPDLTSPQPMRAESFSPSLSMDDARFRTIYENAPFMINSFDHEGRVVLWNQACTNVLGYSREEMNLAIDPLLLFYPDQNQRDRVLNDVMRADGQFREYKVRTKRGEFVHQMWANYALPDSTIISVGYDISCIRDAQEQLLVANQTLEQKVEERTQQLDQERAKLVSASKFAALGEMAGGIAHEINNPLAVIAGLAEHLDRLEQEGLATLEVRREMLGRIQYSVTRISKVIAGLRAISRDASRDAKVKWPVGKIIHDTLSFCGERFRSQGVLLEVVDAEKELLLEGRPIELSQVLLNLLNNTFDAVQDLPEKWVRISLGTKPDGLFIRVTDSGGGIKGVAAEKMFHPFFTTKPVGSGTGLGLSISKGIAEAHGGSLRYELDGAHTSFVLQLPLGI